MNATDSTDARFAGLIAAAHSPFRDDGSLNLEVVPRQIEHLLAHDIKTVFICGSTGESHSLSVPERLKLAQRWCELVGGTPLRVMVHVGANCLGDARELASHAARLGATAIAAQAPCYFKPANVDALVACCADTAAAAPDLPFFYYDIPALSGVVLSMPDFLVAAQPRIPNLAGLKFTNLDLVSFQLCRQAFDQQFDILWGLDEMLLAALALGARGAVGTTYNFAAPLYHSVIDAFQRHDWEAARREQLRAVQLVRTLARYGFMASSKVVMARQGVPVGPPRLPHQQLTATKHRQLCGELDAIEF